MRTAVEYDGPPCDLIIAMHARRSADQIIRYRRLHPEGPLILALTGTDLYRDIQTSARARESMATADRLVVLQPAGLDELPAALRAKTRVIFQSCEPFLRPPAKSKSHFLVTVLGHLRSEKDPFRAADAARRLPAASRVRIIHLGRALSAKMAAMAQRREESNPRYRWLGEVTHWSARRWLAKSHLMVLSSRMEGGANALSEAIMLGVPVLASRIPGSVGILGPRYPGLFDVGDTSSLTDLIERAENDAAFYARLQRWCQHLATIFDPSRERAAWARLLKEFRLSSDSRLLPP